MPARDAISGATALCGLGMTELGPCLRPQRDGPRGRGGAARACADAGLAKDELDGLLINAGISQGIDLSLAPLLGLRELSRADPDERVRLERGPDGPVRGARGAPRPGAPRRVRVRRRAARARASAPAQAYGGARGARGPGWARSSPALGFAGPIPFYAMHAQRHMDVYGTTQDQLGAIALAARAWARNESARADARAALARRTTTRRPGWSSPSTFSTAVWSRTARSA